MVPTRELCIQVYEDLTKASKYLSAGDRDFTVVSIYGGRPYEPQIEALRAGADVVVGTPGRLLDLAQQGHLQLGGLAMLVLDEADEMLDLGFLPDIERILALAPSADAGRQSMLFSATMPDPIITLARTFMNRPTHIRAEDPQASSVHDSTEQFVYRAHALDKIELVSRILQADGRGATMIFTRTKRTAQKVSDELAERGFAVGAVHGDLGQIAREKALTSFRSGQINVLVATDVAARGIDIDDVTHVINYQCPEDDKTYVHRIGRTGRAGRTGIAVTLVDWDDIARWQLIDKALGLGVPEPDETYSTSPHLFTELNIPADVTGSIGEKFSGDRSVASHAVSAPRARNPSAPGPAAVPARASPPTSRLPRHPHQRRPPRTEISKPPLAVVAVVAAPTPPPRPPPRRDRTGAAHPSRHHCRGGDRRRGSRYRHNDLVDQRRPRHRQPPRRRGYQTADERHPRPRLGT